MSPTGSVVVRVYGCSDVGRTRDHNEDAFVVADLATASPIAFQQDYTEMPGDHGAMFMVADGMGGAAAGEIASSMAVDVVLRELQARWSGATPEPDVFAKALVSATSTANERIHAFAKDHPEYRGMGTTATVAGILGDTLYIAQVGDSRAYLIRNGFARQLTKDQSLMQRLIEAGEITAEEAEVSERRNIILQALGPEAAVKVDITHQQLRRGDTLVLCSDGLSGLVRDREIAQAVLEEPDLRSVCLRLIAAANERGGPDNITVVVAHFEWARPLGRRGDRSRRPPNFPRRRSRATRAMQSRHQRPTPPTPISRKLLPPKRHRSPGGRCAPIPSRSPLRAAPTPPSPFASLGCSRSSSPRSP